MEAVAAVVEVLDMLLAAVVEAAVVEALLGF
jgi:hypothetical protein